jgi:methyl-accepting chemotaxis protein
VSRINTNLQAISANIYRISGDPRPENRSSAQADIKDEVDAFKKRFAALSELVVSEDSKARLAKISNDMDALNGALKSVYQAAEGVQNFQMTQEMQQVRDAAGSAGKLVGTLRNSLRGMMEIYGKRVIDVNNDAGEAYLHVSTLMMIAAGGSIVVSLLFGFLIGQYGVAKPVRALVILLQKLAGGDYDVEVEGTDRKDEIGDVAKTAIIFKENGLAKIRMEREQKELEKKAVADREAAAAKLASEFEAAVGGIV